MMGQLTEDLAAFASHAKRKTVEKSDFECVMKRTRLLGPKVALDDLIRFVCDLLNPADV